MTRPFTSRLLLVLAFTLFAGLTAVPAAAGLTQVQLAGVGAVPAPGAAIPLDAELTDPSGTTKSLRGWLDRRPALLILSDYRCTQVCGPMLSIAGQALQASRLTPGQDFNLLVVDFNPRADAADGASLRATQLGAYPDLASSARFLTGSAETLARLETALGFRAIYDGTAGRYAHPTDVFVLTGDGHLSRLLNGLSLDNADVHLALVEAGNGRIGSLIDRLHLLCYGLDPLSGVYTADILVAMKIGAGLTLVAIGLLILGAMRRRPGAISERGRAP